jgi:hypothetical protein
MGLGVERKVKAPPEEQREGVAYDMLFAIELSLSRHQCV